MAASSSSTWRENTNRAGRCRSSGISGAIGPSRTRTEHGDLERLPGLRDRRFCRGRLVAAMRHAVRAFLVLAGAVGIPVRGFHQFLKGLGVAFAQQVAGLLPAEDVARRHAPGRAVIGLVAGEEIEEQVRVDEIPVLALAHAEHLAEQLLGLAPAQEVLLVGRALIGVAGRDRHADAELLGVDRGRPRCPRRHGRRRSWR